MTSAGDYVAGDILAIEWAGDGTFHVAKVLVAEEAGLHVCIYADRFDKRPLMLPRNLRLGSVVDESYGVPHLALTWDELGSWAPVRLGRQAVGTSELRGYAEWQAAGGAFVGRPPAKRQWWDRFLGR